MSKNKLYFGDNLDLMRNYIPSESVDLIYLDPPFNSKDTYNVLYGEADGTQSAAQITAFEDTWHWGVESEEVYRTLITSGNSRVTVLIQALRSFLGTNDMMAYLTMMAIRLVEMHRVLKPTGSIYLHCDPTASHYLKLLLDSIFGFDQFRNEIVWDYSFRLMDLPSFFNRKHDVILFYAKSKNAHFTMPKTEWTREDIIKSRKQQIHVDENGEEWIWMPGGKGHSKNKLKKITEIIREGKSISDVWQIPVLSSSSKERLGYPTQKPEMLLERIINSSSKEGDVILDPFCGCGTAVAVAERLNRKWIGMDITHLAITLMKHRLENAFGRSLSPYEVIGDPKDLRSAIELAQVDRYQFEWWVLGKVSARPAQDRKKGADSGIDGHIYFIDDSSGQAKKIVIQVKSGHVKRGDIATLKGDMEREKAVIGVFITLEQPTRPMKEEAASTGFYTPELYPDKHYPKLQIFTIEELLDNRKIDYPRVAPELTFKRVERKQKNVEEEQPTFDI